MRFDVVLNALHLYKSRSQASVAIQAGTALLNGARVKPSHAVAPFTYRSVAPGLFDHILSAGLSTDDLYCHTHLAAQRAER